MDYNDLLLSRHLDQLKEDEMNDAKFNARVDQALKEFSLGVFDYQDEVYFYISDTIELESALRAFTNSSHGQLTNLVREAVAECIRENEGEE